MANITISKEMHTRSKVYVQTIARIERQATYWGRWEQRKEERTVYLLPVVSVCTGRQVRPAPPSCYHRSNIIHMYLHFRRTIWLSSHRFVTSTRVSIIAFVPCFHFENEFNLARSHNSRTHHQRQRNPRAINRKGHKQKDRTTLFCNC